MTASNPRPHLVERVVEAMGGAGSLMVPARRDVPDDAANVVDKALLPTPMTTPLPAGRSTAPAGAPAPFPLIDRAMLEKAGLLTASTGPARNRLAEEIAVVQQQIVRTVKATIAAAPSGRAPRTVLVTSARPNEGKTYLSLNIAASIAAGGAMPVLLVDADTKRGSLSELLGCEQQPGLRLLASNPAAPIGPLLPTALRQLSVLPYGPAMVGGDPVPPGAKLALAVQRLAAALPNHIIILDAPPCLATSDAASLAPSVGQILMVVAAEMTQRSEVEAALDMVDACPTLQLVLNRAQLTSGESFGAYGYGEYGSYGA